MMTSIHKNLLVAKCPTCSSLLSLKSEAELQCTRCGSSYPFSNGYLNLLPPRIRAEICTKGVLTRRIKDKLHVSKLTKSEQDIVKGILASNNMAKQYFKNVVHPTEAAWSARSYERFEDIFIVRYLDKLLKDRKVAFIDAGSGPGRYLLLLGSKICPNSCRELKSNQETRELYRHDSSYEKNLRHVIGIDYSEEMTSYSTKVLRRYGLGSYLYEKIFPIAGIVQDFSLGQKLFDGTYKVVVCTFQTLGNQESRELQVQLLKSMKKLAMPQGTMIISVFNKNVFRDFGLKTFYGKEVRRTVGQIIASKEDVENSILRTTKGVYSKWFSKDDLAELFKEAGITNYKIMDGDSLRAISGYEDYLKVEAQTNDVFSRAIIGMAQISTKITLQEND